MDASFFDRCALVSVDLQEGARGPDMRDDQLPKTWKELGFTAEDVNAASAHTWEVCLPNAARVVTAARRLGLKMVFLHWGYRFQDGMDLDPEIYRLMKDNHGDDPTSWSGYIGKPDSQPARILGIQPGEYVIAKSGQDAFSSSPIEFVLRNLGIERLVFIGGHTEACLGKTATSAKRIGFKTLCISDATSNARESTRLQGIRKADFDHILTTAEFEKLADSAVTRRTPRV